MKYFNKQTSYISIKILNLSKFIKYYKTFKYYTNSKDISILYMP